VDPIIVLQAGVASGTVLLFATLGEIFAERSGVLNLGVEGMMLFGAMSAYGVAVATGSPWLAIVVAMLAAGLLSQLHAFIVITLQSDQVVSGLALTFVGTGLSLVLGEGLSKAGAGALLPVVSIDRFEQSALLRPIYVLFQLPVMRQIYLIFINQSVLVYLGYLLVPLAWYYIYRTRAGMNLRAIGEYPAAADSVGVDIYRLRYLYVFVGGMLAGLAGATISLAVSPGWFSELTTGGQGWIAVGLVIFAQWDPLRAAFGAYAFGALRRLILDVQGPKVLFGMANPFFFNPYLGFFLQMLPYAFTILILVFGSREAARKRLGAPAALGTPYVRGERGL
jgi:simple sugar transport system permease protein